MSEDKQLIRARWAEAAGPWEAHGAQLRKETMPVSAWMVDAIGPQPGDRLLELAAGPGDTGFLAAELIKPGGELISSDLVPEMLMVAQRRAEQLKLDNVRFKQIDAETSIDIEAASIDGVLCRWGYMLMTDPETALRETRRVLKPGGRLALAAWAAAQENPWTSLIGRALVTHGLAQPPTGPGQFAWAEQQVIADHLEAVGFVEFELGQVSFTHRYASFDDWWRTQAEMSSRMRELLPRTDPAEIEQIRVELVAETEPYTAGDGSLTFPARTWTAVATA
jgi:SAM-dependent methyltransferase